MEKPKSIYEVIRQKTPEHLKKTEPDFGEWHILFASV